MGALVSIQWRLGCVGFIACTLNVCDQRIEIIHKKRRMSLTRRFEIRFDSKMKLNIFRLEPCSTAFCKFRWFRNFCKSQQIYIKLTSLVFFTGWHRDLNVVNREDGHSESVDSTQVNMYTGKTIYTCVLVLPVSVFTLLRLHRISRIDPG